MHTNHLIQEKSPYLLQHAHNPVDWYPWCREAFERAKTEDKPIFLSVGYSTCHWCHVMERESFEDEEVAELLNENYISIKVDREERPDVDGVYMDACQLMNGSGGWPLTVLMTAEQEPFFVGTYLPKGDKNGQVGLISLLEHTAGKWKRDSRRIRQLAREMTTCLQKRETRGVEADSAEQCLRRGVEHLTRLYDEAYGGFSRVPKFPTPHNLLFLLKRAEQEGQKELQKMAEHTLVQMYRGGIFDHIGGGFSRYSTDNYWLVPHFEKMLYDNALLALAYLEAYRMTERPLYLWVAEHTLSYMEEELTHEKGGFFCGQDADSEGVEGKYYVFIPEEVSRLLGKMEGLLFNRWFDITERGNFEGKSIPNLLHNRDYEKLPAQIERNARKLKAYRAGRTTLSKDDKILTSWNGLAIWAFARAHQITGRTAYYKQAKKAAAFVRANLMTLNGRLKVRWRQEDVVNEGNLDDYAFYALSLLELYQCDFDIGWLRTCIQLTNKMLELFADAGNGGFFFTGTMGETLISRPKENYDGALPSGNSVAGLLLVRLSKLTGELFWQEAANAQLSYLMRSMKGYEAGHTMALFALIEKEAKGIHLVCVTKEEIPEEEIRCFRKQQKETVYAYVITEKNQKSLAKLIPQAADYEIPEGEPLYYVCRGSSCQPPVTELTASGVQNEQEPGGINNQVSHRSR